MNNPMKQLEEVAFLGSLLEDIHSIASGIKEDSSYHTDDAVDDLFKLAKTILDRMGMKNF